MVIASIYGNVFLTVSGLLAIWSLWWIIKAARSNPSERNAEVEARERVAQGGGWADGDRQPRSLTDDEIAALSAAQAADEPAAASVDAQPRERRGRAHRKRS